MNDRFKFRWYSYIYQEMCEVNCIEPNNEFINFNQGKYNNISTAIKPENGVLMQSTGLKDKNGKLVYEGDIIEVKYQGAQIPLFKNEYTKEPEPERFEICWNYGWCCWTCKNDNYKNRCEIHSLDISKIQINGGNKTYEVIGNIYENKELLEEECQK